MRTLARLVTKKEILPQQLPDIFQTLAGHGIHFWRATVHMIAGVPGAMKTYFVFYYVARLGLPTLYFSADTDAGRMVRRAVATLSGETQAQVQGHLDSDPKAYQELLEALNNIRWVFESDPTYQDLELETAAFAEAYGDFPKVVVVDTLMNVVGENEDEFRSMREHTKAFHRFTRITNAAVFVQHHMREDKVDPQYPPPRSALQGRIGQLPEMILSLAFDGINQLRICQVKGRDDKADASGRNYATLYADPARGQFYDSEWAMHNERPA